MSGESDQQLIRGACHHDCPDACAWEATVERGTVIRLRGADKHPLTRGQLCPKVSRFVDRVYHPDRVLTPLRRTGSKGRGAFEPISWDDAIEEVAARLSSTMERSGPEAVLQYSFDGTQGVVQKGIMADRFFDAIGASDIRRHLCGVTAWLGASDVSGVPFGIDPEDLEHARTLILWGTNTLLTNRHLWPAIEAAKAAGATIVVIDPILTQTAESSLVDTALQIKPGSDVALVLGMIHIMERDGLLDEDWLDANTTDWESLRQSALEMDPGRAAEITGVSVDRIEWLARLYATKRPAAIRVLVGPEHREHGRDIMRAVATLPAVTGAWRDVGGGLARSTQVYFETALNYPHNRAERRKFNMAQLGKVLNDVALSPPLQVLFVHNSNPAAITPDQNAVIAGLAREDLFTVVVEQFITDTARYADIVLPATTQLEHLDLMVSWGHLYVTLNNPAVAPVGQALPNTEIFRRLAAAMGLDAPGLADTDEEMIRQLLDTDHHFAEGISYARLVDDGWVRLNVPRGYRPYIDSTPDTDDGRLLLGSLRYRSGTETAAGDPDLARRYPLNLMSRKQHVKFLNANYGGFADHYPRQGEPRLEIHAVDADARSIHEGDRVEIRNDRGTLTLTAAISEAVQPGLVTIPFGWWHRATPEGRGVNALMNSAVGRDGIGSSFFHENLVEVSRAD